MSNYTANKGVGFSGPQFLWVLVILDFSFQIFDYIPIFQRHYFFWIIGLGLCVGLSSRFFSSKSFIWLVLYILVVLLNFVAGDPIFKNLTKILTEEGLNFLFPAVLTFYLFRNSDYRLFSVLIVFWGIFLIESSIVSFWANEMFPGIMRLQSNAESTIQNEALLRPFMRIGMSRYSFPHAMPIIIPGLICAIRNSQSWQKIFLIVVLVAAIVLAYASASFTALTVSALSLIMSLLVGREKIRNGNRNRKSNTSRLIIIGLIFAPFILSTELQLYTIRSLENITPQESLFYHKLVDIEASIEYDEATGSVADRKDRYNATRDAITENIIIGTNKEYAGGHSAIPDRLACLGLIGMIPYFIFLFLQIKYAKSYITKENKIYYYMGLGAALIMLFTKGICDWSIWVCLLTILPALLWWKCSSPLK